MKTIAELLTGRPVLALGPETSALAAALSMRDHHVGAVLVVDPEGRPLGIFTERDLMLRVVVAGLPPAETAIGTQMSRELYCASVSERLVDVAGAMQDRHIRHLPVTEESGRVVGLLSLRDLLRELLRQKDGEVRALTDYIQGAGE